MYSLGSVHDVYQQQRHLSDITEITQSSYRNRDTFETINECVKTQLKLSTVIHVNNHSSEACR